MSGSQAVERYQYASWHIMMERTFKHFSKSPEINISQLYISYLSLSVESGAEAGQSFTHACPDWKEGTYELFKDWAAKQFGDSAHDDEEEVPVHHQRAKDISFKRNESGQFILPPMTDYTKIRQKQRVIRAYAGAVYSKPIYHMFFDSSSERYNRRLHWQLDIGIPLHSRSKR